MANHQVFISWSGNRSKQIALIWKSLIEDTFDSVNAFVSDRDVSPGQRGLATIKEKLDGTSVGIPIVTRDNVGAPWINFESGALSKEVPDATVRVMPCLVDYTDPSELTGPLTQFQAKLLNRHGVEAILSTIADANQIEWQRKKAGFEARWNQFEEQFEKHRKPPETADGKSDERSEKDMLAEIVNNTRELRKAISVRRLSARGIEDLDRGERTGLSRLHRVRAEVGNYSSEHPDEFQAEVAMDPNFRIWVLVSRWSLDSREFLERLNIEYDARIGEIGHLTDRTRMDRPSEPRSERDDQTNLRVTDIRSG